MIKITDSNNNEIQFTTWKFPTGETGFKLTNPEGVDAALITTIYQSDDDIMQTLFAINALQEIGVYVIVYMPYLPYSRQDRVCHKGESFSLRVLADIINTTQVKFFTDDLHNYKSLEMFDSLISYSQGLVSSYLPNFDTLIAPDKGAASKIIGNNQAIFGTPVVTLNKQRIGQDIVYMDQEFDTIKGNACVIDDLCDGGGTFISLAKMLKNTQPNITSLSLYVTHGFFTKGIDVIKQHYDKVYVYNLYNPAYNNSVINLKEQQ
jgi:ribose-phosphate pyrophosphokinase